MNNKYLKEQVDRLVAQNIKLQHKEEEDESKVIAI